MKRLIIIFCIIFLFTGCSFKNTALEEKPLTAQYTDVLDTFCTLSVYGIDKAEFDVLSQEVHKELERYDRLFNIYNDYEGINNIKTINDNAGKHIVYVDADIIRLIQAGKDYYSLTDGAVNIAMGSVLTLWHNCREQALKGNAALPSREEMQKAAEHTDINSIEIDQLNSTVYIKDSQTSIDVGAVAKGYIADELKQFLAERGVSNALLNLGGNIVTMGMATGQDKWVIGIQNPDMTDDFADVVYMDEGAAVTSGDYQRYFDLDGKRYCHIIDGDTLFPGDKYRSVTIMADNSAEADAMSTALFILPLDKGRAIARERGFKAVWIMPDGSIEKEGY